MSVKCPPEPARPRCAVREDMRSYERVTKRDGVWTARHCERQCGAAAVQDKKGNVPCNPCIVSIQSTHANPHMRGIQQVRRHFHSAVDFWCSLPASAGLPGQ